MRKLGNTFKSRKKGLFKPLSLCITALFPILLACTVTCTANARIVDGAHYTLAVKPDGTPWVGREDTTLYLADGTTTDREVPIAAGDFAITATRGHGGTILPSGSMRVSRGDTKKFTVTPHKGYHIDSVTGCGGTLLLNTYTTGPISADCTVTINFAINTYTLSGNVILGKTGLGGVAMKGLPGVPRTSIDGTYSATVEHGWSGTVTPTLPGYSFSPSSVGYTYITSKQVQDYTATPDLDGDGVPDEVDNCMSVYNPNQNDLDGDGVGDVCDNCPKVSNLGQEDSNKDGLGDACAGPTTYTLIAPTEPVKTGSPIWVTVDLYNGTGQNIVTIRPDCFNTFFTMTDDEGKLIIPRDIVRAAYGIPDDVIKIPSTHHFTVTCDLSARYDFPPVKPNSQKTYIVAATYSNYFQDPSSGVDLFMGSITTNKQRVTIIGDPFMKK